MKCALLLPAAYVVDHLAGDPEWFPHPVRIIGQAITRGEEILRHPSQSSASELISGAGLTIAIVGSTYWLASTILTQTRRHSSTLGNATELLLAWTCIAARNLSDEASAVTRALHSNNLPLARRRLARIVGRETEHLDASEISRAVVETLAESASDGIVAPLFYMALGGVPLALAYKAVNTLDSMIGHADARYFYFGKATARLDDLANFLPSRLTAIAIAAASCDPQTSLRICRRDGNKNKSPNAGQPEAAISGALRVSLGGLNTYANEFIETPRIGAEFPRATHAKAVQAISLIVKASLLCLIAVTIVCHSATKRSSGA